MSDENQKTLKVVLWGPSSAGKTMYLAQLYHQRDLYKESWIVRPTTDASPFVERMRDTILTKVMFPPVTPQVDKVNYSITQIATGRTIQLSMEDRPGQQWEVLDAERQALLAGADGLILLFDPLRELNLLQNEVERTLLQIYQARGGNSPKDNRPYSICMTKSDEMIRSHAELEDARTHPDAFVRKKFTEKGYDRILACVEDYCTSYSFYPVSSIGVRVRWGVVEPVVFYDERMLLRPGWPTSALNLMEPIAGLLDRLPEPT